MFKWYLLILFVGSVNLAMGQDPAIPAEFLGKFASAVLPDSIGYSYNDMVYFGAIYHTDTVAEQDGDSTYIELVDVYEKSENYHNDQSLLIDKEFVKQYLLPDAKYIYYINERGDTTYSEPIDDYLNSEFYAMNLLITTKNYYGVTYERLFSSGDIPSSEKYFCTFSKTGRFISRIEIASFVFSGTGFSDSGARFPWFKEVTGCISKDMTIDVTHVDDSTGVKYKVRSDGTIQEIK